MSQKVSEYYLTVTTASLADLRSRHFESYPSQRAGSDGDDAAALIHWRSIRPLLVSPRTAHPVHYTAIAGTDLLQHLTEPGSLQAFDDAALALAPVGDFVSRNRRLAAAERFDSVLARSYPLVVHGLAGATRLTVWQVLSVPYRIGLAAEIGMWRGHIVTQNLTLAARKCAVALKPAEN